MGQVPLLGARAIQLNELPDVHTSTPPGQRGSPDSPVVLTLVIYEQGPFEPDETQDAACPDVSGTIGALAGQSYRPIAGALLAVRGSGSDQPIFTVRTVHDGGFTIPGSTMSPSSVYSIRVSRAGYFSADFDTRCTTVPPLILLSEESNGSRPLLQFEESAQRYVFDPDLIETLPLDRIRSFDSFALLLPGVLPAPAGTDARGPGLGPGIGTPGQYSINGARARENNFEIDGSDNNDEEVGVRRQGFVSPTPQTVESITELQVITALADARYGRNIGGQVDALSRLGGAPADATTVAGAYHGLAYGFLSNQRLNARNFFNAPPAAPQPEIMLDGNQYAPPAAPSDKDPFTRSQAGFTLNGPMLPRRLKGGKGRNTFLFGAFERQAIRSSVSTHFNVPRPDQRRIFAGGEAGIYPASLPGDAIFSLIPLPNNPSGPYGANTFTTRLPSDATGYLGSLKIDQQIHPLRSVFTGRYNRATENSELPSVEGALDSTLSPRFRTQNVATYFDTNVTPNLTNTFRSSFGQTRAVFHRALPAGLLPSQNYGADPYLLNAPLWLDISRDPLAAGALPNYVTASSQTGSALLKQAPSNYHIPTAVTTEPITGAIGQVAIAGFSPVGVDPYRFPQQRADHTFQFGDLGTWVRQKHTLHVGFDLRRVVLDSNVERNARTQLEFNGLPVLKDPTFFPNSPLPPGGFFSGVAMAAAGQPSGIYQTLANTPDDSLSLHRTQIDFFAQYFGRLTPRFELSAGLRVEYYKLPEDSEGRLARAFNVDELTSQVNQASQERTAPPMPRQ